MKILHISTFDVAGGAARAAYRVHDGLGNIGIDSQMLVRVKSSQDKAVIVPKNGLEKITDRLRADLNLLPLRYYKHKYKNEFSSQWLPDNIVSQVAQINPDIVNLHWVGNGYLQLETISKFNQPVVWTLMDMWAFTGGCYYSGDCDRYTKSCGTCPLFPNSKENDLSRAVWQRKVKAWKDVNLTLVAPTTWMAKCASSSSLFQNHRVEVIPFCLDTETYKPVDKKLARQILNLPQDKQLVLFGAVNPNRDRRKGFHLLQLALQKLAQTQWKDKIEVVVFGSSEPEKPLDLGFKARYLGRLNDDITLAIAYSAADVMIAPSIQEAFGQTASEAIACATPVIAFDNTGLADIIEHQRNGYLAKSYETDDLAQGIAWVLGDSERHQKLCLRAREKAVTDFPLERQARMYASLYSDILKQ
jgi:glycosyltransferase involved in cell wall biosynthesis